MRIVRELFVEGVTEISETIALNPEKAFGLRCMIDANLVDQVVIQCTRGSGTMTLFAGSVLAATGSPWFFGGPVNGDFLTITWSGTLDFKRGLFELVDEHVVPFGRAQVSSFSETGVATMTNSGLWSLPAPGVWVNGALLVAQSTLAGELRITPSYGPVTSATPLAVATLTANTVGLVALGAVPTAIEGTIFNSGVANADVEAVAIYSMLPVSLS